MNLKMLERKFHTKHLPYTTVAIIFALFVALLVTVVIAFNGSYNSYERSFAYVGQFCDPTHKCPAGEWCSSVTATGTCKDFLCNPNGTNVCPGGCKDKYSNDPPIKDNDCKAYCACEFGCSATDTKGGTCIANSCSATCPYPDIQHCEARLKQSGTNAICINDVVTSGQGKYTFYCHDSGRFCSPVRCPTELGYTQYVPNPNPNTPSSYNQYKGDIFNGCYAAYQKLLGQNWVCCQKP